MHLNEDRQDIVRLMQSQEMERGRAANQVREELGAQLLPTLLELDRLHDGDEAGRIAIQERIRERILAAMGSLEKMARELRPPALDELGLAEGIEQYAQDLEQPARVQVVRHPSMLANSLAGPLRHAAFRFVQEAVGAILASSASNRITVTVRASRQLELSIRWKSEDGGPSLTHPDAGVGLRCARKRIELLGGRLEQRRQRDDVELRALLPLASSPPDPARA